jgi:hypothetical protein
MQEDCGISVPGTNGVIFDPEHLRDAFNIKNPDMVFDEPLFVPERIFLCSDPNADGTSNTTVFTCFWAPPRKDKTGGANKPRMVMLGLDVKKTRGGTQKDNMILNHIKRIRQTSLYSKVPIIAVFENNTGEFATHGEELVVSEHLKSVVALHEGGPNKPAGIRLTKELKVAYLEVVQRLMDGAQLVWAKDMFTNSTEYAAQLREISANSKTNVELIKDELQMEMSRMRIEKGKITGKVGPYQDDMAITLMMCSYWSQEVENKYSRVYKYYRDLKMVHHDAGAVQDQTLDFDMG